MNLKHLLEDECAGERPPKRQSTPSASPPSLPMTSPEVPATPGEDEDDDCIVVSANRTPLKNISTQYNYFSEQQEASSPTWTPINHQQMAHNSKNAFSALVASNESGTDEEVQDTLMDEIRDAAESTQAEPTQVEPSLLDDLQMAIDYMEVTEPSVQKKPETATDLEPTTPQKPKPYACPICNNRFARQGDLRRHCSTLQDSMPFYANTGSQVKLRIMCTPPRNQRSRRSLRSSLKSRRRSECCSRIW